MEITIDSDSGIDKKMKDQQDEPMLIDCQSAAKTLGVSQPFLRKLMKDGEIPFYKLSERTTRFDISELRNYLRMKHVNEN